ncbi:MAG: hypothetical protein ACYCWE_09030 [Eubacteriales bacterium]
MNINNKDRSEKQMEIINTAINLWSERFYWIEEYIISFICNLENLQYVTQRFFENCLNFSNEFQKYYSFEKARIFESLLFDYYNIMTKLLNDIKSGDNKSLETHRNEWIHNANQIAELLESLNPYWTKERWQYLIYGHLELIEYKAKFHLTTNCKIDLTNNEEVQKHMLRMAYYMAEGIIQQFFM